MFNSDDDKPAATKLKAKTVPPTVGRAFFIDKENHAALQVIVPRESSTKSQTTTPTEPLSHVSAKVAGSSAGSISQVARSGVTKNHDLPIFATANNSAPNPANAKAAINKNHSRATTDRSSKVLLVVMALTLTLWCLTTYQSQFGFEQPVAQKNLADAKSPETKLTQTKSTAAAASDQNLEERANRFRQDVGWKLNRERMEVEIQNRLQAPSIKEGSIAPFGVNSGVNANEHRMMDGLPLIGEAHLRANHRDRSVEVRESDMDARIQAHLFQQQQEREWERQAQKKYIEEFVSNAKRDGYDVQIDNNGNVIMKPNRQPTSSDDQN